MAPPSMLPLWSLHAVLDGGEASRRTWWRCRTRRRSSIQNTAPGPPAKMAVPTPTMLPVPMVADSAVVRAPNWLMSPGASGSLVTDSLMAVGSLRWMKPVRKVRNRCDPRSSTSIGGPRRTRRCSLMIVQRSCPCGGSPLQL